MLRDALLLAAALAIYGWYLKGGPLPAGWLAARRFVRLAARSGVAFGGGSVLLLALAGRLDSVASLPAGFGEVAATALTLLPGIGEPIGLGLILLGLVIGGGIGAAVSRWRGRVFAFGDVTAVMPQVRAELGSAAMLAGVSGVGEELFFRLVLPLLVAGVTGSAWVGFGTAAALFGFAHRYQGWIGVVATTLVGVGMTAVYLASGALWMAMVLHAAINLNGLVLRPLAMGVGRSA